jgi:hypothetical protein
MGTIYYNKYWWGVDVTDEARVWTTDQDGVSVRKSNISNPVHRIADGINHMYGQSPRILFQQCQPLVSAGNTANKNPLYQWVYDDDFEGSGEYNQQIHIVSVPRVGGHAAADHGCASIYTNAALNTGNWDANAASLDYSRAFYTQIYRNRLGITNTIETIGLSTYNDFVVLDAVMEERQEVSTQYLESRAVDVSGATRGSLITADAIEGCRDSLHHLRTCGLPVMFSWAATGQTAEILAPESGIPEEPNGIRVSSDTRKNILDNSSETRTASTPGPMCPAYLCGRGSEASAQGKRVKCMVQALGRVANAEQSRMTIRFEGPAHIVDNYVDVSVGVETASFCGSNTFIYLNSNVTDYELSNTRNKVDIFASINAGVGYIYGLRGWMEYE